MKLPIYLLALSTCVSAAAQDPAKPKSTQGVDAKYSRAANELWTRYVADLAAIQRTYITDLLAAHEEAMKRKDLDEAQSILEAVKQVQDSMKALTVESTDPVQARSKWSGANTQAGKAYPAALAITSRKGDQFHGTLEWETESTGHAVVLVEGTVTGAEVVFNITQIQKGKNVVLAKYTGKCAGKDLSGNWISVNGRYKGEFSYKQTQ